MADLFGPKIFSSGIPSEGVPANLAKIDFNTTLDNPAYLEGRLFYDKTEKTLSYYNDINGITVNLGQENYIRVINQTGVLIVNGAVVYVSGAAGDKPSITLARADALATSEGVIGLVTNDIAHGGIGYVTTLGLVHDLNTNAYLEGAELFLSPTTAGALTSTRPTDANFVVRVGIVTRSNVSNGHVLVYPQVLGQAARPSNQISVPYVGAVLDMKSVEDAWRHFFSGTVSEGCAITNNGNGTVSFASGEVVLRSADTQDATLKTYTIAAAGPFTPTDNDVTYFYIDYNSGSPVWAQGSSISTYNGTTKMQAYTVARIGNFLSIVNAIGQSIDGNRKLRRRDLEWSGNFQNGFWHTAGGTTISASGLNLILSTGKFYYSLSPVTHSAFDTTVAGTNTLNVFDYYYNRSSYVRVADQKAIDALQYDNAGTLTTMTNTRYRTDWVYLTLCGTTPRLSVIQGNAQYTSLALAQAASTPATVPGFLDGSSVLVGQVVIQKSAASVTVVSALGSTFTPAPATDHNTLGGLQGGTTSEYYHLTAAEYTSLQARVPFVLKSVTTTYTQEAGFSWFNCAATADYTVTLLTAVGKTGQEFVWRATSDAGFIVTLTPAGSETIDGLSFVTLQQQWDKIVLVSDGTNWMRK